jgi:hypothetical protein
MLSGQRVVNDYAEPRRVLGFHISSLLRILAEANPNIRCVVAIGDLRARIDMPIPIRSRAENVALLVLLL